MGGLLYDLCVGWGFCLPAEARERIINRVNWTASEFATEVLRAEGFIPEYEKQWMRKLARRFEEHFGKSSISAADCRGVSKKGRKRT
jgi:hypothetical protein